MDITITPTALWFPHLSEEEQFDICRKYEDIKFKFKTSEKGLYVTGRPAMLFKLLLDLSYEYDIELS